MNFIYSIWAKAGGTFSVLILIYVLLFSPCKILSIQSAGWLNLAFLMLHQFEEYVYPGGFKDFFNNNLYKKISIIRFKLNDRSAFHVNVTLGWTIYFICAVFAGSNPVFLMIILGITFINGIAHTGAAIVFRKYNPGLITGLFFFIPFTLYITIQFIQNHIISSGDWLLIIISAASGTFAIPLTLFIFREK